MVNEPIATNGSLRPTLWSENFGEDYIAEAFKLAKKIDPKAKMYVNDYDIEHYNLKSQGLFKLVQKLKSQGVPIDGVGFQCHATAGKLPHDFAATMKRYLSLGVEVAITELDVALTTGNQTDLAAQANDYAFYYKTCLETEGCVSTTVWGFSDKFSWRGQKHPCLWDTDFKPRPAVAAVEEVLKVGNLTMF